MTRGACFDLPPPVLDKYFTANGNTQPFEYQTAKAICGHCAIRAACLGDAIGSPGVFDEAVELTRGGESGRHIAAMRYRHFIKGEPVSQLVLAALQHQRTMRTVGDFPGLRKGRFSDARPVLS